MLLENKNAVVYGGSGSVGGAGARVFAHEGAKVFLAGCTLATLEEVAEEISAAGGVAETAAALFGIGLGWNFSYVAATAELADRTVPVERGKILGFTDLCSGLLGAPLALLGGLILSAVGLGGLGVVGIAVAVAPMFWILQIVSKHSEYTE